MRNRNIKLHTAVAVALGALSLGAQAGTLNIGLINGKAADFATEVFGSGSDATPVVMPTVTYTVGDSGLQANTTVTFNLGSGSFGRELVPADFAVSKPGGFKITNGGKKGDSYVTLEITPALVKGDTVQLTGYTGDPTTAPTLVGLRTSLNHDKGSVAIAVSNSVTAGGVVQDPTDSKALMTSHSAVLFNACKTDGGYVGVACQLVGNNTINSADADTLFSVGDYPSKSFTTPGQKFNHLGSFTATVSTNLLKADGQNFNVSGADKVSASVTTANALTGVNGIWLEYAPATLLSTQPCSKGYTAAASQRPGVLGANGGTFTLAASDLSIPANGFAVCLSANGKDAIGQTTATAALNVHYFAQTYQDDSPSGDIASLVRNGVVADVPYILSANNAYQTYTRVVNLSTIAGPVFVKGVKQDGTINSGKLEASLGAGVGKLYSPADLAKALGSSAPALSSEFTYVSITGGFAEMDAIELTVNPNGTVTQYNTNPGVPK